MFMYNDVLLSVLSAETRSPMKYFMEEIYGGISLRSTTTPGNDIERERIYDTIFRLPWRCEVVKLAFLFFDRMNICCLARCVICVSLC